MSNIQSVEALLARTQEVEVNGVTFTITVPEAESMRKIREKVRDATAQAASDETGAVDSFFDLTDLCMQAALEIEPHQVAQVLALTGGENGELARTVRQFLGIGDGDDDLTEEAVDSDVFTQ